MSRRKRRKNKIRLYLIALLIISLTAINIYCTFRVASHVQLNESNPNLEEQEIKEHFSLRPKETCALLFFGLPKLFKEVAYPSIQKNILKKNSNCDIYLHTYNISFSPRNARNKEPKKGININEVYLMTENVTMDTEREFYIKRNVTYFRQFFPPPHRNWMFPLSMDNMIKQWHSIERVWNLMEEKAPNYYKRVGLFRIDLNYSNSLNIYDGDAVMPEFGWNIPDREVNDRLFYGKYEYAKIWATNRFPSVKSFMQTKIAKGTGLHSETILYYIMKQVPFVFRKICAKRIRSTGRIEDDCWCKDYLKVCDWAKHL